MLLLRTQMTRTLILDSTVVMVLTPPRLAGCQSVFVSNIYGRRIDAHFHCGHNISNDPKLLMTIKAIKGVSIDELSEAEKEIAAKAVECGYLRKVGDS